MLLLLSAAALAAPDNWIQAVAFAPDGRLASSKAATITIDGDVPRTYTEAAEVDALAWTPDGRLLAASGDNTVTVHAPDGDSVLPWGKAFSKRDASITALAVSPDGRWAAAAGWDRTARVWDLGTGKLVHVLEGHGAGVRALAFSPDSTSLATGANDGNVAVWSMATGRPIAVLDGRAVVVAVAFSPDGTQLFAGSDTLSVFNDDLGWSLSISGNPAALVKPAPGVWSLAAWRTLDWAPQWAVLPADDVVELEFAADGRLLAGVFQNGTGHRVLAIKTRNGDVTDKIEIGYGSLLDLDVSGRRLAAGRTDGLTVLELP